MAAQGNEFDACAVRLWVLSQSAETRERGKMMGPLISTLLLVVQIAWFILIAHIIMSWLISFQVLNTRQPLVAQLWYGLNQLLEPIYRPIRRLLPATGGLDFAPLVVIVLLFFIRSNLIALSRTYAY
jgi:YggT family protein